MRMCLLRAQGRAQASLGALRQPQLRLHRLPAVLRLQRAQAAALLRLKLAVDVCERHLQGWDTRGAPDAAALQAQRERALALGASD